MTPESINIEEALKLLEELHAWSEQKWPASEHSEVYPEEANIIHNYCISIAEALGVDTATF